MVLNCVPQSFLHIDFSDKIYYIKSVLSRNSSLRDGFFCMNNFVVNSPDGKPVFVGREDPQNPPTAPVEGSKLECPVCHGEFDYLLGEKTDDGGVMGCEVDWKPAPNPQPILDEPEKGISFD